MSEYWFRPKTYGYGATPTHWKGWASVIIVVALFFIATFGFILRPQMNGSQPAFEQVMIWAVIVATLIGGLVILSKAKTDGEWKWRWGDKD